MARDRVPGLLSSPPTAVKVMADWEPVLAYGTAPEGTQLVHRVRTPARSATMAEVPADVEPGLASALAAAGIERLYRHQAAMWRAAAEGDAMVVTGTASGKSLAFNLPVLDAIARDPSARALYLYPDQGAGAGPGSRARSAACTRRAAGHLRRRHPDRGAAAGATVGEPDPDQPGHAARRHPARPLELGGRHRQPALRGGRRGARLPGRVRLARGERAGPAAADRRRLRRGAAVPAGVGHHRQPGRGGCGAGGPRAGRDRPGRVAVPRARRVRLEPAAAGRASWASAPARWARPPR